MSVEKIGKPNKIHVTDSTMLDFIIDYSDILVMARGANLNIKRSNQYRNSHYKDNGLMTVLSL